MKSDERSEICRKILREMNDTVLADSSLFEELLTAVLARGHVLTEDVPGTGKTLTARTMAELMGLEFNRIQFTPDLLPSDVTGTKIYNEEANEFQFNSGPLFSNVVLADEINRSPSKTQAALLKAMEERQVTVEGETFDLPRPFIVIATQNPVEQEGTFPLPEAQIDRFLIKTSIGYPDEDSELQLLEKRGKRTTKAPQPDYHLSSGVVEALRQTPEQVAVQSRVNQCIVDITKATRNHQDTEVGVSPRGTQRMYEASRARAVIQDRDFVVPDDIKALAGPVFAHRLVLTTEAKVRGTEKRDIVQSILDSITVPKEAADPETVS